MGAEKEVGLLWPSHPGRAALPHGPSHSVADFFQPMFMTDRQLDDRQILDIDMDTDMHIHGASPVAQW